MNSKSIFSFVIGLATVSANGLVAMIPDQPSPFKCIELNYNEDTVKFSPDGTELIMQRGFTEAKIQDVRTGECLLHLPHGQCVVKSAEYSPDGNKIITTDNHHSAFVWDRKKGSLLLTLEHEDIIKSATFSHNGKLILTASQDRIAKVWDADKGNCIHILEGPEYATFSPDDSTILTLSDNIQPYCSPHQQTGLWDTATGRCVFLLSNPETMDNVMFSPDGQQILAKSLEGLFIKDGYAGNYEITLRGPYGSRFNNASWSPDSKTIVAALENGTACIWDTHKGTHVRTLRGHEEQVVTAVYSADGKNILTSCRDQTARIWNTHNGCCLLSLKFPCRSHIEPFKLPFMTCSAQYSPRGDAIVTAYLGTQLWRDCRVAKRMFALALAQHKRVGQNSPARYLPQDVLHRIAHYAEEDSFGPIDQSTIKDYCIIS